MNERERNMARLGAYGPSAARSLRRKLQNMRPSKKWGDDELSVALDAAEEEGSFDAALRLLLPTVTRRDGEFTVYLTSGSYGHMVTVMHYTKVKSGYMLGNDFEELDELIEDLKGII